MTRTAFRIIGITLCGCIINFLGAWFATSAIIPLYLDSLLTLCVVASCGLIPGMVCAVFSNMAMWAFLGSYPIFTICHMSTAIISWLTFRWFDWRFPKTDEKLDAFLWAGFFVAISNAVLGNLISDMVYGAVTGLPQTDIVAHAIYTAVPNRIFCIYVSGFMQNLTDKMLSASISFMLYRRLVR